MSEVSGMRAGVLHGRRDLRVATVPQPGAPGTGEVLLQVRAVGICGTDAAEWASGPHQVPLDRPHRITGHAGPTVLGHEFSGVVVAVGESVPTHWRGRLVACAGAVTCGTCPACRAGGTSPCPDYWVVGLHRDGALAPFALAPVRSCAVVDDGSLTAEEAALAQPMAIAVHAARRGSPQPGERAVVVGVGGVGMCLVHVLSSWGVAVTAVDLDPGRLAIARELGAVATVHATGAPTADDVVAAHADPASLVYEVTGAAAVLESALAFTAPGGRIVLVGMQKKPLAAALNAVTLHELQLIGTNALVPGTDLPEALRLLATRAGRWDVLAPRVLPLSDLVAGGLAPLAEGRVPAVKVLVDPTADMVRPLYTAPRS